MPDKRTPLGFEEDPRTIHHFWHPTPPVVKTKLVKNTKGYGWEITAEAESPEKLVELLQETESELMRLWGGDDE